jgi:hypothetical protein
MKNPHQPSLPTSSPSTANVRAFLPSTFPISVPENPPHNSHENERFSSTLNPFPYERTTATPHTALFFSTDILFPAPLNGYR